MSGWPGRVTGAGNEGQMEVVSDEFAEQILGEREFYCSLDVRFLYFLSPPVFCSENTQFYLGFWLPVEHPIVPSEQQWCWGRNLH